MKLSDSQLVRELCEFIGPTLVALTSGTTDRSVVTAWITGTKKLKLLERNRLETAHRLLNDIAEQDSNDMARVWFIGANCGPETGSPCEALRDDRLDDAMASANRWLSPEEMGG